MKGQVIICLKILCYCDVYETAS